MKERFLRLIRNHTFQVVALVVIYILIACFLSLSRHYHHLTFFDLGVYAQSLQSTLHGDILYSSLTGMNYLGYHFSPILFLLVPIFWLAPYAETLLIVLSIALGASGYLVYKLARIRGLKHRTALFVEVLFLLSPLVWGVNLSEFHGVALAVPTLLIMLIGLIQRRWKIFAIGLVLSLMVQETTILVLIVFGLVMLIAQYMKSKKVDKMYLVILFSAIVTYGIAVVVARAVSGMDVPPMLQFASIRYSYLGEPIGGVYLGALRSFFSLSSMYLLLAYFLPLGFLPLFSPRWAAPAIFILVGSMLATYSWQHYVCHYPAAAIPFLFMALITTLIWMEGKGRVQLFLQRAWKVLPVAMIAITVLVNVVPIGMPREVFTRINILRVSSHDKAINRVISQIPDGVTVTAQLHIFPHLCIRTDAYAPQLGDALVYWLGDFGVPIRDTEYLVIDSTTPYPVYHFVWGWTEEIFQNYLQHKYDLVDEMDGVSLYRLKP